MASSQRVQRALAAVSDLTTEEREELVAELILSLEREGEPESGYNETWAAEIRRRVDAVVSGQSKGVPWSLARREIEERVRRMAAGEYLRRHRLPNLTEADAQQLEGDIDREVVASRGRGVTT